MKNIHYIQISLVFLTLFVFSCTSTRQIHFNDNIEKRKWKKELVNNEVVGKKYNDTCTISSWIKENPDTRFAISDSIKLFKSDFNNDGCTDILLCMNLEPSVGGNIEKSSLMKLIYYDGEDVLTNSLLKEIIERKILFEYAKQEENNSIMGNEQVIFRVTGFNKTINGDYKLWKKDDAHCCPSFEGKFTYNIFSKKIMIKPKRKQE